MDKLFAGRLLEERKKINKNRKEFSRIHDIAYGNLESWETGRRKISLQHLEFMERLGADIYYIVTGKRNTASHPHPSDQSELLTSKDKVIAGLERENELLREKLESTSDNRDLIKIAEKAVEIYEQRRAAKDADESAG